MADWKMNRKVFRRQVRTLVSAGALLLFILGAVVVLLINGQPERTAKTSEPLDLTGIIDESFTEAATDHAITAQQTEMESLKKQMGKLTDNIKEMSEAHQKELEAQKEELSRKLYEMIAVSQERTPGSTTEENLQNPGFWHKKGANTYAMNSLPGRNTLTDATGSIHTVSFRKKAIMKQRPYHHLNPARYVPSNTSVRAVILGGADSDASVNGQSKNNGVMLFKFLEDGTLPNGQRSRLSGCRVSANSYGDISSERAFATLHKLSCAHPGQPIIDKKVTGWVFFNGKVGIKGKPLMRDNKVMTWAGVSGALSGIASAAQYAQSVQSISPYGATSIVPSGQIAPFAAYAGAAKAADTLSQYYVKRAEQYHPVIQVGSGNVVTVVFEDGFYLEPEEEGRHAASNDRKQSDYSQALIDSSDNSHDETAMNFTVPPEVLQSIDRSNALSRNQPGVSG